MCVGKYTIFRSRETVASKRDIASERMPSGQWKYKQRWTMAFSALSPVSHTLSSNWNFAYFCLLCGDGEHKTTVMVLLWKRMRHISLSTFRGFKAKDEKSSPSSEASLYLHSDGENHCLFSNLICIPVPASLSPTVNPLLINSYQLLDFNYDFHTFRRFFAKDVEVGVWVN